MHRLALPIRACARSFFLKEASYSTRCYPAKALNQNTHPAYLSVEVAIDKSTSGKISIPQVVSVSEVAGLSLTWSQTQYICQHACVSTLHAE